jgi:uncharacterized protein YecE (DUF72 family)
MASQLFLGTQGWTYPSWVGPFYPPGTPQRAFLPHYATQFKTVELDTTFYAIPRESTIVGWREKTPDGFQFSAKFPQVITHQKVLVDCREETNAFISAMTGLDEKLGPLLLQMPPSFSAGQMDALATFLEGLPTGGIRFALEVRHKSWMAEETFPQLLDLLRKHGIALCLVQHAWMPALDALTAAFTYVRWLGRREDIPDDDFSRVRINRDVQLDRWASQISDYLRNDVTVYGYFNNHYQGHSPASVRALQQRLALNSDAPESQSGSAAASPDNPTLFDSTT